MLRRVAISGHVLLFVFVAAAVSTELDPPASEPTTTPGGEPEGSSSHLLVTVQRYLWGYVATAISTIGLLGNGLSIAVLCSPRMSSSTSDYLAALAAADAVILLMFSACMGLPQLSTDYRRLIDSANSLFIAILYPVSLFAQMFGTYTTACFTVERCLSVMLPLRFGGPLGNNRARARRALLGVTVFCLVYNAPRAFEYVPLVPTNDSSDAGNNSTDGNHDRTLRSSLWYNRIYSGLLYTLFMYALPLTVIASANALLIRAVRAANRINNTAESIEGDSHNILSEESSSDNNRVLLQRPWNRHQAFQHHGLINSREQIKRLKRETSISIMLASIVMVFIFCQTFCFADNLLAVINYQEQPGLAAQTLYVIAQFMVVVNSSVNFLLFCFFGEKFRCELNRILSDLRGTGNGNGSVGGGGGGNRWRVGGLRRNWTGPATANGIDVQYGSRGRRNLEPVSTQPLVRSKLNFMTAVCSSAVAGTSGRGSGDGGGSGCIPMRTLSSPSSSLSVSLRPQISMVTNTTSSGIYGTSGISGDGEGRK